MKKKMFTRKFITLAIVAVFTASLSFAGCGKQAGTGAAATEGPQQEKNDADNNAQGTKPTEKPVETPKADPTEKPAETQDVKATDTPVPTKTEKPAEDDKKPATDTFKLMVGTSSEIKGENGVYKITTDGEYVATGTLSDGQIVVDAPNKEVVIILSGTSISCSTGAPIYFINADSAKVKVVENTVNYVNDNRTARAKDDETEDKAAIYATCDLDITGKGTLYVKAGFNNGIHTKDSLSLKNVTLNVEALNNALKGNDEVEIKSGNITLTATKGNGIKTENTDISKKGNQKGKVIILSGTVTIISDDDPIAAAFSTEISDEAVVK